MMRTLLSIAFTAFLVGCAIPTTLPTADDLKPSASKVVVIGKFELLPPLDPEFEQKTHWNMIGDGRIVNKVLMATGDNFKPVSTSSLKMSEWQKTIEADWGKPFMIEVPRRRTWLLGGMTQLDVYSQDRLWFPGGFYFDVPEDVDAIYIGTLRSVSYTHLTLPTIYSV